MEYYTCSTSLLVRQSIRVDIPLGMLFYPLAFHIGEFSNEVDDHLCLHGSAQVVLHVKFAQLNCP